MALRATVEPMLLSEDTIVMLATLMVLLRGKDFIAFDTFLDLKKFSSGQKSS